LSGRSGLVGGKIIYGSMLYAGLLFLGLKHYGFRYVYIKSTLQFAFYSINNPRLMVHRSHHIDSKQYFVGSYFRSAQGPISTTCTGYVAFLEQALHVLASSIDPPKRQTL